MPRVEHDAYMTPPELARALVDCLPITATDRVLEPHVGAGAFANAAADVAYEVDGLDIRKVPHPPGVSTLRVGDFLRSPVPVGRYDWVIGNPPYKDAELHVRKALKVTGRHVAFLLRLAFLEGVKRSPFWEAHPARKVWVLAGRPSFIKGKTDQYAYGFFWWDTGHTGPTTLERLSWKRRRKRN